MARFAYRGGSTFRWSADGAQRPRNRTGRFIPAANPPLAIGPGG